MLVKFVVPIVPSSYGSITLPEPEGEGTVSFVLNIFLLLVQRCSSIVIPKDLYCQQWHCERTSDLALEMLAV